MSDLLIIVANNDDQKSLEEMAKQSKIVVNAVGPVGDLNFNLHNC